MSEGLGFGPGNSLPARRNAATPGEPEISGASCLWKERQIPHTYHAWKWGPVTRWCSGVEDAATRPSAAPQDAPGAQGAPVAGGGGAEASQDTTGGVPGSVPEELIRPLAEKLLSDYDKEFNADHLSWQDFAGQARELLEVVLPAHEAMVRQRVAEELEAAPIHKILAEDEQGQDVHAAWCPGCRAAKTARGEAR